jgi:hypothetical protein
MVGIDDDALDWLKKKELRHLVLVSGEFGLCTALPY